MPPSNSRDFLGDPGALNHPWFLSPFFERVLESGEINELRCQQARRFREDGYLVVEGLFEAELIDKIVERYDWLFDPATRFEGPDSIVHNLELDRNRRQDAWGVCPAIRDLACHPKVLDLLTFLHGRGPIPFQTLNFLRGTTQSMHSDAFHFSSIPSGFMCGVWVALEATTEENGPLMYARGSHQTRPVELSDLRLWADRERPEEGPNYEAYEEYVRALLEARDFPIERLVCPKGTALIWSANLLHGGAPIVDPESTRMSQVTHYYFEDCVYYTPLHSNTALGELDLRPIRDIRTSELVPHRLGGKELQPIDVGYASSDLYRMRRTDEDLGGDSMDPVGKLQGGLSEAEDEVAALLAERETLFDHADDLEGQLTQIRAEADASRGRLSSDIGILLTERERLSSDIQGFLAERETLVEHAADLDEQLAHIRSRPSHRLLGALKDLLRLGLDLELDGRIRRRRHLPKSTLGHRDLHQDGQAG
jgi:hypothetical protein